MIDRTTRLRWRRLFRRRKRQVEDLGLQTEEHLERHFFRRFTRLRDVKRFVVSWLMLFTLLIVGGAIQLRALSSYYQQTIPIPGGSMSEGVIGAFTNANPLYANGPVDSAVARLVFSSLFVYDANNLLVGDLVENWTVDERGTHYTFYLKPNIKWHDGKPLTAEDVVFTYQTIQNPDAKSPLFGSWQGIKVATPDDRTVTFTLPNVLTSFPYALTNGIVPKHILSDMPPNQLRSASFNSASPVGSGPFKWDRIEVTGDLPEIRQERIGLIPNDGYYGEQPKLQHMIIHTFRDEKQLVESFNRGELQAMAGLTKVPDTLKSKDMQHHNVPLTGEVFVFFKMSQPELSDVRVRQAMTMAVNVPVIVSGISLPTIAARGPLLPDMIGYDKTITQLSFDQTQANALLDQAGWLRGENGMRAKDNKPLVLRLYGQQNSEYEYVSTELAKSWQAIGVDVQAQLLPDPELQGVVSRHDYDMLLYGISLGTDPDVFAYWHSTQADPRSPNRLNFSEYKSSVVDKALEAGRTRSDATIRAVKYKPFLEAWRNDAPALALYQPRFLYVTRGTLFNFEPKVMNSATDRYNNVVNWMIRQAKVDKQ